MTVRLPSQTRALRKLEARLAGLDGATRLALGYEGKALAPAAGLPVALLRGVLAASRAADPVVEAADGAPDVVEQDAPVTFTGAVTEVSPEVRAHARELRTADVSIEVLEDDDPTGDVVGPEHEATGPDPVVVEPEAHAPGPDPDEPLTADVVAELIEDEAPARPADEPAAQAADAAAGFSAAEEPATPLEVATAVLEALAAQMALVDHLAVVDFRFERIPLERFATIRDVAAVAAQARDALVAPGNAEAAEAALSADARAAIDDLHRDLGPVLGLAERLVWHLDAVERESSRRESRDRDRRAEEADDALQAVEGMERHYVWGAGEAQPVSRLALLYEIVVALVTGNTSRAAEARTAAEQAEWPRWLRPTLLALAFVVLPALAGLVWTWNEVLRPRVQSMAPAEAEAILSRLPGKRVGGDGYDLEIDVFDSLEDPATRDRLVEVTKALAAKGFDEATFRYGGTIVARWKDGHLRPEGSAAPSAPAGAPAAGTAPPQAPAATATQAPP